MIIKDSKPKKICFAAMLLAWFFAGWFFHGFLIWLF